MNVVILEPSIELISNYLQYQSVMLYCVNLLCFHCQTGEAGCSRDG